MKQHKNINSYQYDGQVITLAYLTLSEGELIEDDNKTTACFK